MSTIPESLTSINVRLSVCIHYVDKLMADMIYYESHGYWTVWSAAMIGNPHEDDRRTISTQMGQDEDIVTYYMFIYESAWDYFIEAVQNKSEVTYERY